MDVGIAGKEKNYVYCHLKPAVRVYQANPKPIGIAFGGSLGNERISLDEDFGRVVVRHHAVDKTYQPGPLFPNQVSLTFIYLFFFNSVHVCF
jgi:TLD